MAFYPDLRDNIAGPLIVTYGQDATLRQDGGTYSATLGRVTESMTDTAVKVVTLPVRSATQGGSPEWKAEVVQQFEQLVLMSAKETNLASVSPVSGDTLIINSQRYRIIEVADVAPAGIVVVHKMGVARA